MTDSILARFKARCSEELVPMQVTLELTYRCNERCGHCYLASYDDARADPAGRPPLTRDEWARVVDELAAAGTLYLVFIGGEAMMHPHFWSIAEHASTRSFALSLITNGLLVDDAAADRIADLGFHDITISLYSLRPEIHDAMTRRKGSHQRTLAAIERLRRRGVFVGLNCLLTRSNIDGYFELEDWARAQNILLKFDPQVTAKSNGELGSTGTRATGAQLLRFYRELRRRGRGPEPALPGAADDPVCNAGRGKAAVNAYGDLLTCLEVRDPIGNLRERPFHELWRSPKAESLRGHVNRDLKFDGSCGDGAFCDHCPGMARAESGDGMAAVPFLMEIASIKRRVFEESL